MKDKSNEAKPTHVEKSNDPNDTPILSEESIDQDPTALRDDPGCYYGGALYSYGSTLCAGGQLIMCRWSGTISQRKAYWKYLGKC